MEVQVQDVGRSKSRVIIIDDFLTDAEAAVAAAAALPAYPSETRTAYPGQRHQIGPGDKASSCVAEVLRSAGPLIQRYFEADTFRVFEASFSLVTTRPEDMSPRQRAPHYDSTDPNYLALLLHLHRIPGTGTAFYRHVASDLEQVSHAAAPVLGRRVQAELAERGHEAASSDAVQNGAYQKISQVEGKFNRLVIYQGCLLHSGYLPPDFNYSSDPRTGRLTANVFIQIARGRG